MAAFQNHHTKIHYSVQGSGFPLLLMHGIPTSRHLWDYIVPILQHDFMCITIDWPGFGESPLLKSGSLNPIDYAQELEALRMQLSIPSWHMIGHDAGSTIAVHYATQFPGRVEKLALCSPPVFPEFKVPWLFGLVRVPVVGDCLAPPATTFLWSLGLPLMIGRRDRSISDIIQTFHNPFRGYSGIKRFVYLMRWGDPTVILAKTAALLPQIVNPVLILHGRKDWAIPVNFSIRAKAIIPQAELHLLDCGHFLPLSCPEAVVAYLLPFLKKGNSLEVT